MKFYFFMIILRIWRLIPHGCQHLCHSALATNGAYFSNQFIFIGSFPDFFVHKLGTAVKIFIQFIQFSFGGSLMLFTSFLYLMYLLYHKIFCLSTVFFKISEVFRRLSTVPLGISPLPCTSFFILCTYYSRYFFICQYFFYFLWKFFVFFLSLPCKYIISKLFLFVKYKFWEDLCANCR